MEVNRGHWRLGDDGDPIPRWQEFEPPLDVRPGCSCNMDAQGESRNSRGEIDETAEKEATLLDHFSCEGELAN